MGKVILGMVMSLDGFVADRQRDTRLLYPDMDAMHDSEMLKRSIRNTGAVLLGRRTYDMAEDPDFYAADYEYQVPIVVLTHRPPAKHPRENDSLRFIYVTEGIEKAVEEARRAAGDRDVVVIGASVTQQCLRAGLGDELHIDLAPVLLGEGLRLFEGLETAAIALEIIEVSEWALGVHLGYRIMR